MIESDLEKRLERMYAGYARLPVDTGASWRGFIRLRRHAAIRRRAVAAGAAVVVATAVAVATAFAYRGNNAGPAVGRHPNHPQVHAGRLVITARIAVPGAGRSPGDEGIAGSVAGHGDKVWAITYSDRLIRIDPATNRVTLRTHIAGLSDMTVGAGGLWLLTTAGIHGELLKLDPVSGRMLATLPLPRRCGQVSSAGAQLWLACADGGNRTEFLRIDPVTGRVLASAGPADGVSNVRAAADGVWYSGSAGVSGFVGTGSRLRRVNVADAADLSNTDSLVYAQGAIWAFDGGESVAKIDQRTGRIVRVYGSARYDPAGSFGLDFFTVGQGSLWLLNDDRYEATSVLRVSLASGMPQGQVSRVGSCGEPCWQIYVASGSVWVPTRTHITRIDPVSRPPRTARR
jgi:hypothetical protein